jgi:hypothetical protein
VPIRLALESLGWYEEIRLAGREEDRIYRMNGILLIQENPVNPV